MPLGAAAMTLAVNLLVLALAHDYPFGTASRNVSDFGTQYLAFHTQFRRILGGHSPLGNLWFTWTSGAGVPFLPDYAYYLGGPFTPLIGLFPLAQVEPAILAVSLLRLCLAAALMAVLLRRLRPTAPPGPVLLLSAGYGCSSWVFDTGISTPMWLDALWCLPLAWLAVLWCLEGRRFVASALVVALAVWCNYYTAFMVCVAAVVFWVVVSLQESTPARRPVAGLLRLAGAGVLGWLLMSWMLVPTLLALRDAVPVPGPGVHDSIGHAAWGDYLGRLLPVTEGYRGTPAMCLGSLALVLTLSLPLARHLPRRLRCTWSLATIALFALSNTSAALWVWNVFDVPQGNHFRFSFVLCGWLALAAVHAWPDAHRTPAGSPATDPADDPAAGRQAPTWPGLAQLLFALVPLGALLATAHSEESMDIVVAPSAHVWPAWSSAVLVLGSLVGPRGRSAARTVAAAGPRVMATLLLGALWTAETCVGAGMIQQTLAVRLTPMPLTVHRAASLDAAGRAATRAARWPWHRAPSVLAADLPAYSHYNQGLLLGAPTIGYYSSNMPDTTSRAYGQLGAHTDLHGRMMRDVQVDAGQDPELERLIGVQDAGHGVTGTVPMVRTVASAHQGTLDDTFDDRNALLGAQAWTPIDATVPGAPPGFPASFPIGLLRAQTLTLQVHCGPGLVPELQFVHLHGWVQADDGVRSRLDTIDVLKLPAGTSTVRITAALPASVRTASCLDGAAFDRAVAAMTGATALRVTPGHVAARFATPQRGIVVIATPALRGWGCRADGVRVPVGDQAGFLAVPAAGLRGLSCDYREPGITAGFAASAAALALVAALSLAGLLARRRHGPSVTAPDAVDAAPGVGAPSLPRRATPGGDSQDPGHATADASRATGHDEPGHDEPGHEKPEHDEPGDPR